MTRPVTNAPGRSCVSCAAPCAATTSAATSTTTTLPQHSPSHHTHPAQQHGRGRARSSSRPAAAAAAHMASKRIMKELDDLKKDPPASELGPKGSPGLWWHRAPNRTTHAAAAARADTHQQSRLACTSQGAAAAPLRCSPSDPPSCCPLARCRLLSGPRGRRLVPLASNHHGPSRQPLRRRRVLHRHPLPPR
jgi:hypothetical protein